MDSGAQLSLLQLLPWIILLVVLLSVFIISYANRYWHLQTTQRLRSISTRIRQIQTELAGLRSASQAYAEDDPEPYGTLAKDLNAQIATAAQAVQEFQNQYGQVQQNVRQTQPPTGLSILRTPLVWRGLQNQSISLDKQADELQTGIDSALEALNRLGAQDWTVAQKARQMRRDLDQITDQLQQMQTNRVHGDLLDEAGVQKEELQFALDNLPHLFFTASEAELHAATDKGAVIEVFGVLAQHSDPLAALLAKTKAWSEQLQEASQNLIELRQSGAAARQRLNGLSKEIDLSQETGRLDQLGHAARALDQRLSHPEVTDLQPVSREAKRLVRTAQDLHRELDAIHTSWEEWQKLRSGLQNDLPALAEKLDRLAHRPEHPLDWNVSAPQLESLRASFGELTSQTQPRDAEGIRQDVATAQGLHKTYQDLVKQVQDAAQLHTQVNEQLLKLDRTEALAWCQESRKLAENIAVYDPDNWARKNQVVEFGAAVTSLQEGLQKQVPPAISTPLKESGLIKRSEEVGKVITQYSALKEQAEGLRRRLLELQGIESTAQETLGTAQKALQQIALIANSNPFLQGVIGEGLPRLQEQAALLQAELGERGQGLMAKKAQRVADFARSVETAANGWLNRLNADVTGCQNDLRARVDELTGLVPLDEAAVAEAQRLSQEVANQAGSGSKAPRKLSVPLADLGPQFKTLNETWQRCIAASNAMEDIENPVLDAFEETEAQRQLAHQELSLAIQSAPGPNAWPPSQQTITVERRDWEALEDQWISIGQTKGRAIAVVQRLGELARRYASLAERAHQIGERAADEQSRVLELQRQMEESLQLWNYQLRAFRDNPLAQAEIQEVIQGAQVELQRIQAGAASGARNYQQIVQDLMALSRRINNALVSIDDIQRIDINGEVRTGINRY